MAGLPIGPEHLRRLRIPPPLCDAGKNLPHKEVIVSFQQIDTVAAGQAVASRMRRLGM